jgi:hypothetical protein
MVGVGSMTVARAVHTATRLADGRVLIVGGLDGAGGTAELFDPTTSRFAVTGGLNVPRAGHTATLLPNGQVLIAGGYNGSYLSSTELYDPATGRFSPGPSMTEARIDHLVVPLRDGRLLIVGGQGGDNSFLETAELFDPATSRFTATGSMSVPRASHVAAPLPDGRVLVVGGHAGRRADIRLYDSAEIYDPETGTFSSGGTMSRPRHKHSSVVLADGRILITGGSDERDDRGQYRDTEIYDAASARFVASGQMRETRYKHAGAMTLLPDGSVLIAGGAAHAELFDPRLSSFTLIPTSPTLAGSFSTVTPLGDGTVLVTGGYGSGTAARSNAWRYTPTTR